MVSYDYIIAGAGASGLSLLMRLIKSGKFNDRSILLVDRERKTANDHTWCFWEKDMGFFEEIVFRKWQQLWFHTHRKSSLHNIDPYSYKLIRGDDFYRYCFDVISRYPNVTVRFGEVKECFSNEEETGIIIGEEKIYATYVFNSILFRNALLSGNHHYLLQHFKGWFIHTEEPEFNPGEATLMDFRTNQSNGTTFVYVMPFSETEALVEYTLFSANLLDDSIYDKSLAGYCNDVLKLKSYKIAEKEFGVIPMTTAPFQRSHHAIINMGTAGGQTKASSGYTFQFIQHHAENIVNALIKTGKPFLQGSGRTRFDFYDAVLLNILAKEKLPGEEIFGKMIGNNNLKSMMKFLENNTNIAEELYLIRNLPKRIFWKAAKEEIFR
jgi:lycopene beta-cyclase